MSSQRERKRNEMAEGKLCCGKVLIISSSLPRTISTRSPVHLKWEEMNFFFLSQYDLLAFRSSDLVLVLLLLLLLLFSSYLVSGFFMMMRVDQIPGCRQGEYIICIKTDLSQKKRQSVSISIGRIEELTSFVSADKEKERKKRKIFGQKGSRLRADDPKEYVFILHIIDASIPHQLCNSLSIHPIGHHGKDRNKQSKDCGLTIRIRSVNLGNQGNFNSTPASLPRGGCRERYEKMAKFVEWYPQKRYESIWQEPTQTKTFLWVSLGFGDLSGKASQLSASGLLEKVFISLKSGMNFGQNPLFFNTPPLEELTGVLLNLTWLIPKTKHISPEQLLTPLNIIFLVIKFSCLGQICTVEEKSQIFVTCVIKWCSRSQCKAGYNRLLTGECTKVRRLKIIAQLGKPLAPRGMMGISTLLKLTLNGPKTPELLHVADDLRQDRMELQRPNCLLFVTIQNINENSMKLLVGYRYVTYHYSIYTKKNDVWEIRNEKALRTTLKKINIKKLTTQKLLNDRSTAEEMAKFIKEMARLPQFRKEETLAEGHQTR
ncbi:hypothetical protein VP01_857g1 [Puccinia sorghi]|uniref:Uncharacterized protein n=1 Tax=Puccinia sorghi TaxID=27349 RepID=A0A0L6U9P4_9BASI|nr:hypothetical protein VP01_857g1 [Puccinia sorghi]